MKKVFHFSLLFLFVFCSLASLEAVALSEKEFEEVVRSENAELKSLFERKESLKNNEEEADLIYGWQFVGGINRRSDRRPSTDPNFTYDSMNILGAEMGLQKLFSFGLESKIALNSTQTEIVNGNAGSGSFDSKAWDTQPGLELKLPLWSGAFGRKVQADYRLAAIKGKIEGLAAEAAYDSKMNEAKSLLWSTVLQKELIAAQTETVDRIQKIYQIVGKKAAQNLEASSNYLQTRSALEAAELELKNSQLKYSQLERLLKLVLRKIDGLEVPAYDFKKFKKVELKDFINKVAPQEKILSLTEELNAQAAILSREMNRSRLDLVGSISMSGQDRNWTESLNQSQKGRYPTQFVGLQWTMPLDQGITTRAIERQEILQRTALAKKAYYQNDQRETYLQDLVSQVNQMIEMLALNLKLEATQAEKLKNERQLLSQGRSSIYQVLQFELDLGRARTGKFTLALEIEKAQHQLSQYRYHSYE